ncbi:MAG: hypothetical protein L6243_03580 [Candidatus Altiarchaeales archaeon]|nr:hypothetical protein [Candidatus Altiarchaeales archaeon]
MKKKNSFALTMTRDKIRQSYKLSPVEKLNWLEEANEFINKALSPEKRRIWMENFR